MLLGGRAAEEVFYGEDETSTGACDDLKKANRLATKMVTEFGFGSKGILVTATTEEHYLHTSETVSGEDFKSKFDELVKRAAQ